MSLNIASYIPYSSRNLPIPTHSLIFSFTSTSFVLYQHVLIANFYCTSLPGCQLRHLSHRCNIFLLHDMTSITLKLHACFSIVHDHTSTHIAYVHLSYPCPPKAYHTALHEVLSALIHNYPLSCTWSTGQYGLGDAQYAKTYNFVVQLVLTLSSSTRIPTRSILPVNIP